MAICLSKNNTKLVSTGKIRKLLVVGFNLPAGDTCPFAGKCKDYCYAKTGNFVYPNVKKSLQANYEASKQPDFVQNMIDELSCSGASWVRLHSSGDFYSKEYVGSWRQICKALPNMEFYAYTKSWRLFGTKSLPKNLHLICSAGSTVDADLAWLPHAKAVPEGYELRSGEVFGSDDDDLQNLEYIWEGKTVCLVAHGSKKGKV